LCIFVFSFPCYPNLSSLCKVFIQWLSVSTTEALNLRPRPFRSAILQNPPVTLIIPLVSNTTSLRSTVSSCSQAPLLHLKLWNSDDSDITEPTFGGLEITTIHITPCPRKLYVMEITNVQALLIHQFNEDHSTHETRLPNVNTYLCVTCLTVTQYHS